jgi:anaerobic magnesium-protoporphyrin IX monomethyl ester cyclase
VLTSRKVVLFQPPYAGKVLGPPLGLLSLAASLRENGYEPCVIDGALEAALGHDYMPRIAREVADCLCFGVSVLTGPMIRASIEASKYVRGIRPDLPIIFGGWHPSLLPAQTLREDYVDIVIRHQGEKTLVEVLQRLQAGKPLDMVAGCWFKRDGRIHENADRPSSAIAALPSPAYDLIDFDAYELSGGGRKLPYATSIGCPYACNYCTDMVFYNRRFNPYDVTRTVEEITGLVQRHRLDEVALVDSNFLVDVRRAVGIAQGFLDSGVKFKWTFQASTDLLCRMTDEEVQLLGASGVSHIGFGTESASEEVLVWMNKRHQNIPDISEAARKCAKAGIRVTLNLIFGYPGEQERHRQETLRVMGDIASRFDNVTFSPNVFVPYPGIPIWEDLKKRGLAEPASLAEWSDIDLGSNTLPWLNGRPWETLQRGISYFLLNNQLNRARRHSESVTFRWLTGIARESLHWRLRNYSFDYPLELWFSMAKRWVVVRRSLLTGQALSNSLSRTG